jgi:hypothetical protein
MDLYTTRIPVHEGPTGVSNVALRCMDVFLIRYFVTLFYIEFSNFDWNNDRRPLWNDS